MKRKTFSFKTKASNENYHFSVEKITRRVAFQRGKGIGCEEGGREKFRI